MIGKDTIINAGATIWVEHDGEGGHDLVGPLFASVDLDYAGVDIGKNCLIGTHCVIRDKVKIGNNTVLAHHVIVEPHVVIGDNTTVQVYTAFASNSKIGNNCFIGPYFSSTNCFVQPVGPKGRSPNKKQGKLEYQEIGNDVSIGANVAVAPGVKIGNNVEIGMNTFIKADVPSGKSPEEPFKIRGGSVWGKKEMLAHYASNA